MPRWCSPSPIRHAAAAVPADGMGRDGEETGMTRVGGDNGMGIMGWGLGSAHVGGEWWGGHLQPCGARYRPCRR